MINLSFSRKLRLLAPNHFNFIFQNPKRASALQITILGRQNSLRHPRIGLAVAKKNIKRSHERNRIKRLVRESFRLVQHKLPAMDFVVIVKKGATNFDNYVLLEVLKKLWYSYYRRRVES